MNGTLIDYVTMWDYCIGALLLLSAYCISIFKTHLRKTAQLTDNFIIGETHDMHCIQGFLEIFLVLLAWDGNVTIWQETVTVKPLKKQVR